MKKILVLCTGNSCRSQMVEVCLKSLLSEDKFSVFSAGIEAHGINPYMKKAMEKLNYSLDGHTSNTMDEYDGMHFDYVLTVCDHAKDNCPYFKDATNRIHHSFEDPADAEGTDEQKMVVYEKVRDEIIEYCKALAGSL
ncbi:MAG: arsenate reductase ArsC [Flavobacteriales bacterium]|nr:arsenate reductase ArsC [Flavobacteriales bacterium]MBL6873770.1 arsenate reductase ArsC [Flavobacteriales bacterium]